MQMLHEVEEQVCHSKDRMGSVWDTRACRAWPMNFVYKAPSGCSQTWLDIRVTGCSQMDTIQEIKDIYLVMSER